ncbi:NADH-quinone oxidoreductase [Sulfurovum lithotrophicum]|uniref:NADH-quinone oxidoreductase subunit H n=1 Tax=Sulfurovum lithotrophicum TaxID=206403 RepID=A0A7U4LZJ0_9BACT|nr:MULTISPECIES: NADH-quinone oxidoreductase subunit NuoH [Sulfurovum]AKF24049.1 NADH-quinone oxidoreductase [Sulfurovum lithotrophicum]BAF73164.1 NADH-quinone oxidoreductase, chain H [Sulfurovum sp. NBC37-1]
METTLVQNLPEVTAAGVIIKAIIILAVISAIAGFGTFIERKVLAFMQRRLGPMHVGPYGLLQLVADGIKLFTKEDIVPQNANSLIFKVAPSITAATAFIALAAVPVFPDFTIPEWIPVLGGVFVPSIAADLNIGILFVLGMMAAGLYGPLLAGMAQANKWGIIGAARTAIQFLSYEVVTGLSILAPIMLVGSLSFVDFNNAQAGGISHWLIWQQPVAFVLFLIAGFAETNRTPFDLLEHEAEVVSGYATEYSGMRWGMFFIGEYANMITISIIAAVVFLGGYSEVGIGWLTIILKVGFFFFLMLWVRAAWPHVRPDQLMWLCWKVLMPIAVINVVITGIVMMV